METEFSNPNAFNHNQPKLKQKKQEVKQARNTSKYKIKIRFKKHQTKTNQNIKH